MMMVVKIERVLSGVFFCPLDDDCSLLYSRCFKFRTRSALSIRQTPALMYVIALSNGYKSQAAAPPDIPLEYFFEDFSLEHHHHQASRNFVE